MFRSKEGESVAQQIRREQQMDFSLPLVVHMISVKIADLMS